MLLDLILFEALDSFPGMREIVKTFMRDAQYHLYNMCIAWKELSN